uniref:Molybdopterin biosynthesis protein n=1 Tax=Digenea simplex TaxID=945030 RepID=A0A1Z1MU44_DIGSM|nr:Molybdopterin biosynthesis protein [Digenea simplex]ARW69618.1 Molybdopterin biosynthesis protein [Digenea simplex]
MLNPDIHSITLNDEDYIRYSKHLIVENIGIEGQKRLKKAKVLIIGAGGLGCATSIYLVASGIENVGILDNDIVQFSNLNRQILYTRDDIDQLKVESAKKQLKKINDTCQIITHSFEINEINSMEVISYYDIIIDTTDNFSTRYIINLACYRLHKIYVYGAIEKFQGQLAIFNYKDGIQYNDLYQKTLNLDMNNCNINGIMGVTAGHIGILQSIEAIKIIIGFRKEHDNCIFLYNLINMKTTKKIIYANKNITSNELQVNREFKKREIKTENRIDICNNKSSEKKIIIDIRSRKEFKEKHINKSINIPLKYFKLDKVMNFIRKYSKTKILIIYCKTVNRSNIASLFLHTNKIIHQTI